MHKVTTINLNGRAYQLEEKGYIELQDYLRHAETVLAKDPDKAEVLADIEQAIADKCDRVLEDGKNVVTTEQISGILQQMGEVEGDSAESETTGQEPKTKRLFLIREGAMLMGVCQGLGAYSGIDANLLRLAFVILTLVTGGFWIVVYLILGIILPTARTDADLAEAYGRPMTASAIVARVKERAPDAETLHNLGGVITQVLRIIAKIVSIAAIIGFAIVTAAWLWILWLIILGRLHLYEQLQVMNGWREWLVVCAVYLLIALPILLIARLSGRIASNRNQTRTSTISEGSMAVLWGIALVTLIAFATVYAQNFRDYVNGHGGHLRIGNSNVCVERWVCGPHDYKQPRYYYYPTPPPVPTYR